MLAEDHELLARLAKVNQNLGSAVTEMLARVDGGGLPPYALHALADNLDHVVTDLRALAKRRTVVHIEPGDDR